MNPSSSHQSHPEGSAPSKTLPNIRILIVDDHTVVLGGLQGMLSAVPGILKITTANDGEAALRECARFKPHVVILDLRMPVMDGHRTLQAIVKSWPDCRVIIFTGNDSLAEMKLAKRNGAAGFLSKSADPSALLTAIQKVAAGGMSFPATDLSENSCGLSPRELEVLHYLAKGLTNDEIGTALFVSCETIKVHLKHIFAKLGVSTRTEAVTQFHQQGFI